MERNNELPEDRREQLTVELDEATPANSIISVLGDELTSGKVYFVIVGGNEAGKFVINADTGAVTTGSTVDREKQGAYHLQIQVLKRF